MIVLNTYTLRCMILIVSLLSIGTVNAGNITKADVDDVLYGMLDAWNNQDYDWFKRYFSSNFRYHDARTNQSYSRYMANKKTLFRKYSWISVSISNLDYDFGRNSVTVSYKQHFNSPRYESKGLNTLYLKKRRGRTKIYKETFRRDWYQRK